MHRKSIVIVAVMTCLALSMYGGDSPADRRKAETLAKADRVIGQRYSPPAGKPLRLYDKQTESGPADEVIYWYGASYVIRLVFADDGSVARVHLIPEALLHSGSWTDVPELAEVSPADMQWLLDLANNLQGLGNAKKVANAPDGCFQSGPNLYCTDTYERAVVSHYHVEKGSETKQVVRIVLKDVGILYRQNVSGVVEDVRVEGSQRHLKVRSNWYHGEKPGSDIFQDAPKGSFVRLVTYGCTANERACPAIPDESKSDETR